LLFSCHMEICVFQLNSPLDWMLLGVFLSGYCNLSSPTFVPHGSLLVSRTLYASYSFRATVPSQALSLFRSLPFCVRRCCRREADANTDQFTHDPSSTASKVFRKAIMPFHVFDPRLPYLRLLRQVSLCLTDRPFSANVTRCCHVPRRSFSQRSFNGMNHRSTECEQPRTWKLISRISANGQACSRASGRKIIILCHAGTENQSASSLRRSACGCPGTARSVS
jgi:hypothetical protein